MVHRTMGFPHKSKPKSAYCVIWVYKKNTKKDLDCQKNPFIFATFSMTCLTGYKQNENEARYTYI